jgi:hypothetical protein
MFVESWSIAGDLYADGIHLRHEHGSLIGSDMATTFLRKGESGWDSVDGATTMAGGRKGQIRPTSLVLTDSRKRPHGRCWRSMRMQQLDVKTTLNTYEVSSLPAHTPSFPLQTQPIAFYHHEQAISPVVAEHPLVSRRKWMESTRGLMERPWCVVNETPVKFGLEADSHY